MALEFLFELSRNRDVGACHQIMALEFLFELSRRRVVAACPNKWCLSSFSNYRDGEALLIVLSRDVNTLPIKSSYRDGS